MKRSPTSPLIEAQRLLRTIAKRKPAGKLPYPNLALLRQEYDALGPIKVRQFLSDMKTIAHCLRDIESERWREREAARKADFAEEERRLDANDNAKRR